MKKLLFLCLIATLTFSMDGCGSTQENKDETESTETTDVANSSSQSTIEETSDLANNEDQEWTYDSENDAWTLSIVSAVAYPEIPDEQGVSVCVPGGYVTGIDTDADGIADITADTYEDSVNGSLVIDYDAQITSENGQIYTAATAPVILNTGAAGYSSSTNSTASSDYSQDGYINVACGNRGKQDTVTDEDGNTTYTGDAPTCLADQKAATRYVKYNILLGNLPGSVDYFVSTGGSGGGAHATMMAATSNNSDFYDYQIEAGAVGVYQNDDGTYSTSVDIDGTTYEISDGMWGCIAYSAITPLYEADMAMAFEYNLDTTYDFNTSFQAQLAEYLSESYMDYINDQNLSVKESDVGFDLNEDGDMDDTINLSIEYDLDAYPDTNGYYGTYLDLYLAEFTQNLQWYLDNLDYSEDWTWFDDDGNALSDEEVASMTAEDKATAFIEGRYTKSSTDSMMGGPGNGAAPGGNMAMGDGNTPDINNADDTSETTESNEMLVGTPDAGTTQSSSSTIDSSNYDTYEEMLQAYEDDISSIEEGDAYGNNIVSLYNPLNYIGNEDTDSPTWTKIVMGASEGDMSMFNSLNMQIAWLNSGVDAEIEWQWDGGHVPSEILGNSLSLYVDEMYGEYVQDAATITKSEPVLQTENGTATEAEGTDISSWVNYDDVTNVSFTLASASAYRTAGASKAIPGFDVIDYGQEDYVFGNTTQDARHWDTYLLDVLKEHSDVLEPLFNQG